MDELIGEFLAETSESLDVIDVELVKFEADPTDRATLDNIFRLLHTIKGTCGFLGLERLEAIAHAGETLLGKFRDGDMVFVDRLAAVKVLLLPQVVASMSTPSSQFLPVPHRKPVEQANLMKYVFEKPLDHLKHLLLLLLQGHLL